LVDTAKLEAKLADRIKENNVVLKSLGAKPLSFKQVFTEYDRAGQALKPYVQNTVVLLHNKMREGADILFEGAQGTFLDIDHGTYPFVTSSNTTAGGACTGSGVPPHRMDRVVGVMKAYTTRVGEGPLPTENAEISDLLHGMGREFGATTGRARRCGWFDSVATRHASMVNGIDDLAITNLDGLDTVESIKVCVAYRHGKVQYDYVPNDAEILAACDPIYVEFEGWRTPTDQCRTFKQLPAKARAYVKAISELSNAHLFIASVGPGREQTIFV
jgi:adenylosuccinate synthase